MTARLQHSMVGMAAGRIAYGFQEDGNRRTNIEFSSSHFHSYNIILALRNTQERRACRNVLV